MLDPHKMVLVNFIGLTVISAATLFYRFIFPKRNINLFVLLILITILPIINIFRAGVYESGDFNIHLYRTLAFYDSLKEGNIMPSWAKDLNATYGYPLFTLNYSLPYYLISFFHFIGFTFIASLKIFLSLSLVLSGIFMYMFSKSLFKNNLAAFSSSIFYIFAPYHLISIHFKATIGEVLSFTLLPLVFFLINKLNFGKIIFSTILASIFFAALIMSHVIIGLLSGILMLGYLITKLNQKNYKNIIFHILIFFILSLTISSYVWVAPFILTKYTIVQNANLKTVYFPSINDLLYSPWRMGLLFQGPRGEISNLIGYTQVFILANALILLFFKKIPKKILSGFIFWTTSSFIILFLITPYSKFIWESIPLISASGSHRLLVLLAFCISIIAGYSSIIFKKLKIFIYLILFLTIISTILNWGQRKMIPTINDSTLKSNLWKSTSEGEGHFYANPKWIDTKNPWFSELSKKHLEIISGIGEIKNISRTSTDHKYTVIAEIPLKIQENTLYFPGWKGYINGKQILLSPSNKGIIQATIPKGVFTFEILYEDIFDYKLVKMISLIMLSIAIIILIFWKFLCNYKKIRSFLFFFRNVF